MDVEPVNARAGASVQSPGLYRSSLPDGPTNELGKDEFLQLLVAQLKYQDPLEPTSSEQFIATTAQFTVVEKLDELTKQGENSALVTSLTTASSLVGREITANRDGIPVTAVVSQSRIVSGEVVLDTERGPIGLDEILSVGAAPAPIPIAESSIEPRPAVAPAARGAGADGRDVPVEPVAVPVEPVAVPVDPADGLSPGG